MYGKKKILATGPLWLFIVAVLSAWTNDRVAKIWLRY
jgi:hypothetical protein